MPTHHALLPLAEYSRYRVIIRTSAITTYKARRGQWSFHLRIGRQTVHIVQLSSCLSGQLPSSISNNRHRRNAYRSYRVGVKKASKSNHISKTKANIKAKADVCRRFIYNTIQIITYLTCKPLHYLEALSPYRSWVKYPTFSDIARISSTCMYNENDIYHAGLIKETTFIQTTLIMGLPIIPHWGNISMELCFELSKLKRM
jgi:hypothetical protein